MTGIMLIDGANVYTEYGVYVLQDGYVSLAGFPKLKDFDVNDWSDRDGEQVDLSGTRLSEKEIELKIAISCKHKLHAFMAFVASSVYHSFTFNDLGLTKTLRYVSMSVDQMAGELVKFTLKLGDDFPMDGYQYAPPIRYGENTGYSLDGVDLSEYGVAVLAGTEQGFYNYGQPKKALTIGANNLDGVIYDEGAVVVMEARDLTLHLLMKAQGLEMFWRNHNALLYDLKKNGERRLTYCGFDYLSYYKSMSPSLFSPCGVPWLKFSLVLRLISLYEL